ncbi:MAG: DMT family transporter [Pseudomonadota bacterium]|nr:DMT family transporter [Pseudomonadota bacterium]MEE3072628.1 DMT family transporter [Pseudomonadota bacterium]
MTHTSDTQPLRAIFWMLITGFQFVTMTALVKFLGGAIPAGETAFLRFALGVLFLAPVLPALFRNLPSGPQVRLIALRGVAHSVGVGLWFYAMARIPLADVTALNYLNPIYVTLGAVLFLGEKLALRRILAVVVALIGAFVILRPGFRELSSGHIAMLGTSLGLGASYLIAKRLSSEMPASHVVAWMSIAVTIGLSPLAIAHWVTPTFHQMLILVGVAALATGAHYTMTLAFRCAPATLTQPVTFLQLLWAVLIGMVFFHEPPDPYVLLGGGIIIAAVSYITLREARLKRSITPSVPATKV